MKKRAKKFKPTPKKYHPRSLTLLYEDHDILVIEKPSALLTMSNDRERDKTAYAYLNDYVRKGVAKSRNRVFIVHRLDRETSGVLVFAKHADAQRHLQDEWAHFQKTYYAVVHGQLTQKEGVITSYLAENGVHKMYSTKDKKKGKLSKTAYRVVKESQHHSLLQIELLTGRKHQIRVHLADAGHPVVGDKKYGPGEKGIKRLTLHAASMTITHPFSKETMTFKTEIPPYFEAFMKKKPS
ncbi:MAG: RluA family pseudouridine synthase [Verrucomicrobiae bacterium]|nr:RluA family pseudouridine synthase [Verrucomicrobiae bacterium]NNJ43174.1 RluA family pseudouridine synthase [Akkermansiaceae bacterium]